MRAQVPITAGEKVTQLFPTRSDNPIMMQAHIQIAGIFLAVTAAACTVARPRDRSNLDAGVGADGSIEPPPDGASRCNANQPLRCDKGSLVRCNGDGTAELTESCPLGCVDTDLRCVQLVPSNGLARYLDMASSQPDLNLGDSATIDTNTGEVQVGGVTVQTYSDTVQLPGGATIRVFAVGSLAAKEVVVNGTNAIAIGSRGDINISGLFWVTPRGVSSPSDPCRGRESPISDKYGGGAGGGGYGSPGGGGAGGFGNSGTDFETGGAGGAEVGNVSLVPLRGGCSGGGFIGGAGGGAAQLFSRTRIVVRGILAASGDSGITGGGGSGGGILLEAPSVEVSSTGRVVANGGGGSGCQRGGAGGLDATPAPGGARCTVGPTPYIYGRGGNGGAGSVPAQSADGGFVHYGGHGGGGVGRIRINTASGEFANTGVVSPAASKGTVATR